MYIVSALPFFFLLLCWCCLLVWFGLLVVLRWWLVWVVLLGVFSRILVYGIHVFAWHYYHNEYYYKLVQDQVSRKKYYVKINRPTAQFSSLAKKACALQPFFSLWMYLGRFTKAKRKSKKTWEQFMKKWFWGNWKLLLCKGRFENATKTIFFLLERAVVQK